VANIEAQASPAAARRRAGTALTDFLGRQAAAQSGRVFLWSPVALGLGCAAYLSVLAEPAWPLVLGVAAASAIVLILCRRWGRAGLSALAVLLLCASTGVVLAKARTWRVAAPIVPTIGPVTLEGWVVEIASPGASGPRMIIAPTFIEGLSPAETPIRVRVTTSRGIMPPGSAISARVLLNPPPPPAAPGAYDFARNAYFDGIGGVGVVLTQPRATALPDPPLRLRLRMAINAVRWDLAKKIQQRMGGEAGGLGAAMVTGNEAFISEETEQNLRDAGLAHIISISGLHMAIVGGFVFFASRLVIAGWPWLALRISGKKAAAMLGLAAVAVYLVISGAPAPAIRAAITVSAAFVAILLDRRAISLHSLAAAALVVLALQPEAVAEPGFQMSFAATAALVALVEAWPRRVREINTPWPFRLIQNAVLWIGLSMAASFVAGMATGPFAIQHFNRVATYGLPANLLTEPLSTFLIMPCLALGGALEPLGLGAPFLWLAAVGMNGMISIADTFAHAPAAVLVVASAPAGVIVIAFLGILWLCLWKGPLRWVGLPAALAIALWPRPEAPLAWIAPDGTAAAIRDGRSAIFMRPSEKLFGAELWTGRRGLVQTADPVASRDRVFECTAQSCRARGSEGLRLSAWWTARRPKPEVLDALCTSSDILVLRAPVPPPPSCSGVIVLTDADFTKGGAAEIYAAAGGWRIQWAAPLRGRRPWVSGNGG